MLILDAVGLSEAGYWEVFYTDLYRSYGFQIGVCVLPYHKKKRSKVVRFHERNIADTKSDIIDGKDIHYYRMEVFKLLKFYQHT